ncbi:MAG: methylenetetrahydrofolate reductase [Candidatus Thorarchaeota archaeon]
MSETRFKRLLDNGEFVVTAEIGAPHGADSNLILERTEMVRDYCDAINIPDNARGVPTMSSTICAHYVLQTGAEPIMHLTTRDRNRISIQSELYGAYAIGIRNVLFVAGDHARFGSHPEAKVVYDLDTINALTLTTKLRDGTDFAGDELEGVPEFYIGATFNPNDSSMEEQVLQTEKKQKAGAQFFQTQAVFESEKLEDFMGLASGLNLKVLAGIIPLRDVEMAEFMNTQIPEITIPKGIIKRIEDAGKGFDEEVGIEEMRKEGIIIALETIEKVRRIKGINGVHLMGVGWTESIVELVKGANLFPRPE